MCRGLIQHGENDMTEDQGNKSIDSVNMMLDINRYLINIFSHIKRYRDNMRISFSVHCLV